MCLALMVDMVAREVRRVARGRAVRVIAVIILEMGSVKVYVKYFRGCAGVWDTVDFAVEAIKAEDDIVLKRGCGSEAFITKANHSTSSQQNHSASSFPSSPRLSPNQCRVPGGFSPYTRKSSAITNDYCLFTYY